MTRYLLFGLLGLTLSYFILITSPKNSELVDVIGLITFSVGIGLYLKNNRIAGLLTAIGLGITFHVLNAGWYNLITIHDISTEILIRYIILYILLTITFIFLLGLAIHSVISSKKIEKKLNNINIANPLKVTLMVLPFMLMIIEIVLVFVYNMR